MSPTLRAGDNAAELLPAQYPIRNWLAGTPVVIGSGLSADSVFQRTVVGITIEATTDTGYITTLPGS